jgi:hypothetical protein
MHRPGSGAGCDSVNEDHTISFFPAIHQSREITFVFLGWNTSLPKPARRNESHGVIVPELVPKPNDDHLLTGCALSGGHSFRS